MTTTDTTLWEYNAVTGYWSPGRSCTAETAQGWLECWQKDRPAGHVVLSRRRPSEPPARQAA